MNMTIVDDITIPESDFGMVPKSLAASDVVKVEITSSGLNTDIRVKVGAYSVRRKCPECEGFMTSCDGTVLTSCPAQYPHRCDECGFEQHISGKCYPYIEYEE